MQKHAIAIACLSTLLIISAVPLSSAQEQNRRDDVNASCTLSELVLPHGELYPNGVAQTADGTLYVGFVTSGRILRKRPGKDWTLFFGGAEKVFASTSLRVDEQHGLLWGTSPDFLPSGPTRPHQVFALDLSTGAVRRTLTLPGARMGNDIFVTPDGEVYLTDTTSGAIMRLRPGDGEFATIFQDQRLIGSAGIGAAGIVRTKDGTLMVNNFGTGKIYALEQVDSKVQQLREISLPRLIENPDGMGLAPDGSLIVMENAIQSGEGKILRIASPLLPGARSIEVIRAGLESPVNLSITSLGCALVSESRIRHRLLPGREADIPDRFRILEVPLNLMSADDR